MRGTANLQAENIEKVYELSTLCNDDHQFKNRQTWPSMVCENVESTLHRTHDAHRTREFSYVAQDRAKAQVCVSP